MSKWCIDLNSHFPPSYGGGIFLGDNMQKRKEIIAKVTKQVSRDCNRKDLEGKNIVLYSNDRKHCFNRHYNDFENKKVFSFIMQNLDYIIYEYDFVLFNDKNDSLEYYKKLENNITVRVKVENSNDLKIKTIFPVSEEKYEMKKNRAINNKYIVSDKELEPV